jgi:hypothetical protein
VVDRAVEGAAGDAAEGSRMFPGDERAGDGGALEAWDGMDGTGKMRREARLGWDCIRLRMEILCQEWKCCIICFCLVLAGAFATDVGFRRLS